MSDTVPYDLFVSGQSKNKITFVDTAKNMNWCDSLKKALLTTSEVRRTAVEGRSYRF